jgi:intracellular multiplication protein IcmK
MTRKSLAFAMAIMSSATLGGPALSQDASGLLLPPANLGDPISPATPPAVSDANSAVQEQSEKDRLVESAIKSIAPLTPEQVREVRRRIDQIDQATDSPLMDVHPVTRSVGVSLKSGEMPVRLSVAPGWLSTLTFSDVTGQPWPVHVVTNGNPDAYDVKSSGPQNETNIITISARRAHVPSNFSVLLLGAKVPLLVTLDPSSSNVDYRVDARVDQRGPNAIYDSVTGTSLAPTNDSTMLQFLDGVAPSGARELKSSNSRDLQAWMYGDLMYVRTSMDLLSPAYTAKHSNASGVKVFVLNEVPVLLVSDGGRTSYVQVIR